MAKVSTHITSAVVEVVISVILGSVAMTMFAPGDARLWQYALVYLAVFLLIHGASTSLGYFTRLMLWRSGVKHDFARSASRQGQLLASMAVVLLLLSAKGVLNFWSAALLFLIFVLIELYSQ